MIQGRGKQDKVIFLDVAQASIPNGVWLSQGRICLSLIRCSGLPVVAIGDRETPRRSATTNFALRLPRREFPSSFPRTYVYSSIEINTIAFDDIAETPLSRLRIRGQLSGVYSPPIDCRVVGSAAFPWNLVRHNRRGGRGSILTTWYMYSYTAIPRA